MKDIVIKQILSTIHRQPNETEEEYLARYDSVAECLSIYEDAHEQSQPRPPENIFIDLETWDIHHGHEFPSPVAHQPTKEPIDVAQYIINRFEL